jgi:hypothetical protein
LLDFGTCRRLGDIWAAKEISEREKGKPTEGRYLKRNRQNGKTYQEPLGEAHHHDGSNLYVDPHPVGKDKKEYDSLTRE